MRHESLRTKVVGIALVAAAIGGYAYGSYQLESGEKANTASEFKPATDPYEGETVLIYAPGPLTVEQAVEHYVGMDQPRTDLTDAGQDRVVAELTNQYEAQTGESADQPFAGNPNGSQWISIAG